MMNTPFPARDPLSLLHHLPIGVIVYAPDTRILFANEAAASLTGLPLEQLMRTTGNDGAWSFVGEDETALPVAAYPVNQVLATAQPVHDLMIGIDRAVSGDRVWVLVHAFPEFSDPQTVQQIVVTFLDITRRKRAEAALQVNTERLSLALNAANAGTWEWNLRTNENIWSEELWKLYGLAPYSCAPSYEAWKQTIHPADRENTERAVQDAARDGTDLSVEWRVGLPDGAERWLLSRGKATRDAAGDVVRYNGIVLDITERKRTEQAILDQKVKLDAALASMTDAVFISDANGHFLDFNDAFATFHKFTSKDACAKTFAEYPELLDVFMDTGERAPVEMWAVPRALRGEIGTNVEYGLRRKDSGERWVGSYSFAPIRDHTGAITGSVVVGRDITERKRVQDDLRQSEENFSKAFRSSPAALQITHLADGQYIEVNDAYCAVVGYARAELIGHLTTDFPIYIQAGDRQTIVDHLRTTGSVCALETSIRHRSGSIRHVVAGQELITFNGEACILSTFLDITARKQAEAALEAERALLARRVAERTADLSRANAELALAARVKDEFLSNMSHELRTPLNAILGRAELLREQIYGPLTPEQDAAVQGVAEAGQHLLGLINDILDLSKVEVGKLALELEPLEVESIGLAAVRMVSQLAISQKIMLTSAYDSRIKTVVADGRRLKQILVNLLTNAVKFTPAGGKVGLEVHADPAQQVVTFTVWDTGIGIAPEDQARLFQPFVQIDSSLSRQHEGSGLGLALVLRLTELQGGSITLESSPGQGSRFTVALPWAEPAASPAGSPPPCPEPALTAPLAIRQSLVIDDSRTAVEQLRHYLGDLGSRVEVHDRASGAIERARALQPDLIVLDILLPDQTGWEVLRQLKADPQTAAIPVLVISVVDDPIQARTLGAAGFLLKPLTRDGFLQALSQLRVTTDAAAASAIPLALVVVPLTTPARPLVLLVDDNAANLEVLADYLPTVGYDVVEAHNGAEAVARAEELRPALIVMDIQMPVMDGLEATRRIRAAGLRTTPIIALTALAMSGDRERCLAAGATTYLAKPVSMRVLMATITEVFTCAADVGPA